jgi:hypothetical protein
MRPAMKQLVEIARKKNVKFLTDTVPDTRKGALKVFFEFDFAVKNEYKQSKFNNTENVLEIEKEM